ncbi:MAG: hypothetical protein ACFFD4_11630 [Candidatus Odinarchaeota archaeon]
MRNANDRIRGIRSTAFGKQLMKNRTKVSTFFYGFCFNYQTK